MIENSAQLTQRMTNYLTRYMMRRYIMCVNTKPKYMTMYSYIKGNSKEVYLQLRQLAILMQRENPTLRVVFRHMDNKKKKVAAMVQCVRYNDKIIKDKGNFKRLLIAAALHKNYAQHGAQTSKQKSQVLDF